MILFNFSLKPKYVRIVLHECIADSSSSLVFSISSPWLRAKQNRTGLAVDLHFHFFCYLIVHIASNTKIGPESLIFWAFYGSKQLLF